MLYSKKNEGVSVLEPEVKTLSDVLGEKCNEKMQVYFWGFLRQHTLSM